MKTIKFMSYILMLFSLLIYNTACSDDNDDKTSVGLIVSTDAISIEKQGETRVMHLKTDVDWSIGNSETWCTVTPASGQGTGTIKIEVSAPANPRTDSRSATLTVKAGTFTETVTVTQEGSDLLILKQNKYDIGAEGEEINVELQVSGNHTLKINADWITKSTQRAVSDKTERFIILPNTSNEDREGTIDFTVGDLTETVTITQKGVQLSIPSDRTGMDSDALVLASKMGIGWNLGNSLEACASPTEASETMWGNPKTTKAMIDAVKEAGFNTVRIPCAWSGYIENQSSYKIKDSWLARVKEVVDYCVDNDMYAILNIHWDGGWLENNPVYDKQEEVNEKQKALWEQIAVYFRDYDERLLFAGTNEVSSGDPTAETTMVQMSYNQTFVDVVRSTGGRNTYRNLIIQSYATNIGHALDYLKISTDPTPNRMMVEVHYYDPWDFCGLESDASWATVKNLWGKEGRYDQYGPISDWGQEDWVHDRFGAMKSNFSDKGYPVILGEYGAILRTSLTGTDYQRHVESRNYYLNYITKTALEYGMVPVYWDNGNTGNLGFGLFNRNNYEQIHPDAVEAIISAGK